MLFSIWNFCLRSGWNSDQELGSLDAQAHVSASTGWSRPPGGLGAPFAQNVLWNSAERELRRLRHHAARVDQAGEPSAAGGVAPARRVEPDEGRCRAGGQKAVRDALAAHDGAAGPFGKIGRLDQRTARHAALDLDPGQVLAGSGRIGAGEGIRTLDPNLGKVVLYP